jgi:hypothetical protein
MGTRYSSQAASGYNSSPPADDGTQVASNLVTWAGVKTKLADPIKTLADAENTALVAALDLSARAISSPDTAIASDHWKTLQVTGSTTVTLSSAASMGAGYEVGVFNAGVGVVTVTPGNAADTINGLSASVTVSIKGTKIFRTNQALTGYNVVGGYDPQTATATTSVVTPLIGTDAAVSFLVKVAGTNFWSFDGAGTLLPVTNLVGQLGAAANRISAVFTPIIDTGTTGSGTLKTNNGTTVLTWDNNGAIAIGGRASPASGVGVAFPAAQSASTDVNTLDDYEEGTWTPGISFGGGTTGITYTTQDGRYTKIGRQVTVHFAVTLSSKGSSSGAAAITGLPFTTSATQFSTALWWANMTSSLVTAVGLATASGTTISVYGLLAAGASIATLGNADFANTTGLIGTLVYHV